MRTEERTDARRKRNPIDGDLMLREQNERSYQDMPLKQDKFDDRTNSIVDEFVLAVVLDISNDRLMCTVQKLLKKNVVRFRDIRGKQLSDVFQNANVSESAQREFVDAIKPFGVTFE